MPYHGGARNGGGSGYISAQNAFGTPKHRSSNLMVGTQQRRRGRTLSNVSVGYQLDFTEFERGGEKLHIEPTSSGTSTLTPKDHNPPAYVNVPYCSSANASNSSESKDFFDADIYARHRSYSGGGGVVVKRAQIASPESDIITPSAESSEESYLSCQSRVKFSPETTGNSVEFNISLPNRKHSKLSNNKREFYSGQS